MRYVNLTALILIVSLLLFAGCSDKTGNPQPQASVNAPAAHNHSEAAPAASSNAEGGGELSGKVINGVRVIEMEAVQFKFIPDKITVKKGEKVELRVKSTDVDHGIAFSDLNINQDLPPNELKTIDFTPEKTGTFPFHCSVFCGTGHGAMVGEMKVIK